MNLGFLKIISDFPDKNLETEQISSLIYDIPQKYQTLYEDRYKDYFLLWNFEKGGKIILLNDKAKKILDLVDNKKSIKDIFKEAKKLQPEISFKLILDSARDYWTGNIKMREIFDGYFLNLEKLSSFFIFLRQANIVFWGEYRPKSPKQKILSVWLHLTNQCNFRCQYCYIEKSLQKLSLVQGKKIIDKIFEIGQRNNFARINIKFAGGEPLLEFENFKKLVNYSQEKISCYPLSLKFSTATNGSLLNQEIAEFLKKHQITTTVSLDGLAPYHNQQRRKIDGAGTFYLVEQGIKLLKKYQVPFNVNTVITKLNLVNLPEFVEWLISEKIKFFFTFIRKNLSGNDELIPNNDELAGVLLKIYKKLQNTKLDYGYFPEISFSLANKVPFFDKNKIICDLGQGKLAVDQQGNVSPCQVLISRSEYKPNLLDQNFNISEFFNSQKLEQINLPVEKRTECGKCQWKYVCRGGNCPIDSLWHFNRLGSVSYYCPTFKAIIPEALRLKAERLIRFAN